MKTNNSASFCVSCLFLRIQWLCCIAGEQQGRQVMKLKQYSQNLYTMEELLKEKERQTINRTLIKVLWT
ncbi:hypothetical protein XELAEV_18021224mg [Xenopus laevis]|uniref:Secreted protein n=1 Tax=Xenopus laevis TaxID=8355 RepID=A0A974HRG3_XENLA|nr:hypothetical protein XELAEV_18021224mg [Xenopus laevis]